MLRSQKQKINLYNQYKTSFAWKMLFLSFNFQIFDDLHISVDYINLICGSQALTLNGQEVFDQIHLGMHFSLHFTLFEHRMNSR